MEASASFSYPGLQAAARTAEEEDERTRRLARSAALLMVRHACGMRHATAEWLRSHMRRTCSCMMLACTRHAVPHGVRSTMP